MQQNLDNHRSGFLAALDVFEIHLNSPCSAGQSTGKSTTPDRTDAGAGRTFILNSIDNDYQINCCGFVSGWEVYVLTTYGTLYAQVWRDVSGVWTLIGQNSFVINSTSSNSLKNLQVSTSEQISVDAGDFIGFKSSGNTIPGYMRTNSGVGSSTDNVIFSDTATEVVGSTGAFSTYSDSNAEFAIKAELSPGNSPMFTNLPATSSVTDDTAAGTTLFTVTATDADASDNLTYTLTSTNPSSASFNFDTSSGNLTTVATVSAGTTTFTFSVTDQCGNTDSSTFTLTVTNKPPVFQNLPNTTEVSEDLLEETELYILTVTDPTVGDTVTCSSTISPNTNDLYLYYSIGNSRYSIYLRAAATLDYDTTREYLMTIQCTDTKDAVNSTFVVYVTKNEPPVISNLPASVTVSPSTVTGTSIFTVSSTDKEAAQLYYNMTCLPASCPFKIFSSGAVLTESNVVNVTEPGFDLYIYVYDGKNLVGPKVLTVQILESDSSSTSSTSSDWLSSDAKYILVILAIFAGLATFALFGVCVLVIRHKGYKAQSRSRTIIKAKPFL
ncbi:protocadherin-11 X-linked-like [Saccostrea echinata]|uniref:protocadherin-11 X-linked-like n=1 Tax=Saccostrea echinata TaxID=191078 RepID=UPI002A823969|nr:protocadherin-11 X-linked-like [Saccostrea echinata]